MRLRIKDVWNGAPSDRAAITEPTAAKAARPTRGVAFQSGGIFIEVLLTYQVLRCVIRLSLYFLLAICSTISYETRLQAQITEQRNHCDPLLHGDLDNEYWYQFRDDDFPDDDRCEGLYVEPRRGISELTVVSLFESFEDYDLTSGKALHVEWTLPSKDSSVRLKARGLKNRFYYRMDSKRPSGTTSFSWPSYILTDRKASKNDIGIIGQTKYTLNGIEHEVYVPLRISQKERAIRSRSYKLAVVSVYDLEEVYISLSPLNEDGNPKGFIQSDKPLNFGYYPANQPVIIPLPELEAEGFYYLMIGAKLQGSNVPRTTEIWFYHSSR